MALRLSWVKNVRGGRPILFPLALAFLILASTRSRMQSRSNSAKALMIWKSSLPVVVVKSSSSEKLNGTCCLRKLHRQNPLCYRSRTAWVATLRPKNKSFWAARFPDLRSHKISWLGVATSHGCSRVFGKAGRRINGGRPIALTCLRVGARMASDAQVLFPPSRREAWPFVPSPWLPSS
jgi:hypothetical protein